MIEIDGSFGEGGGQILRTAVALAAVLGKTVRISNIRASRPEPGLRAQHLAGVKAIGEICSASSEGLEIGSSEFVFKPGTPKTGQFSFNIGTAGSITLVLQTLMPIMPFLPGRVEVEITGGTDVKWSPPIDYLRLVTLPILAKMGYQANLHVARRGHYPRGGGMVRFRATPSGSLRPITGREASDLAKITGVSHAVGLPRHVAERQVIGAERALLDNGFPRPTVDLDAPGNSMGLRPGSGIVLCAILGEGGLLGADSLGDRGIPAEEVGSAAGERLVEELKSGKFLDRQMGDMIVPYMVLASGASEVSVSRITQHTITNVKVVEWVAGVQFESVGEIGQPGTLRVRGLGLKSEKVFVSARE